MNPQSLQALIIDDHCGELSPEASELLHHILATDPIAHAEAERIKASINITSQTINAHPNLIPQPSPPQRPLIVRVPSWLIKAAAIIVIALLAGTSGYMAGRSQTAGSVQLVADSHLSPRKDRPWARYRLTPDPTNGGLRVVRIATSASMP